MVSPTLSRRFGVTGNKAIKAPVRSATTANISLSGLQTVGGVALVADDRCLVWNQNNGTQNGIYDVSTGAWTRSIDANGTQDLTLGSVGIITSGTYADQFWFLNTTGDIVPGTTSLVFQVGIPQLPILAAQNGSGLSGFIQLGAGAVADTVEHELRDRFTVTQFGADPTGAVDSSAAFAAATAAMSNPGTLIVPRGSYLLSSEWLIPYTGAAGSGKTIIFEGATLIAGTNNQRILHWADCRGATFGAVNFLPGGKSGVTAFSLTPTDPTSTTVLANQNFNRFGASMNFIGLAEGIVLQNGPRVTGTDSGCWYNQFTGSLVFGSTDRCIHLKDGNLGAGSGANANQFLGGLVFNGSINTGIQISNGGGNVFMRPQFENITNGVSPNATPTGLIVANTAINGNSNPDNTFYSAHWENCTLTAAIANTATIMLGISDTDLFNSSGQITPYTEQYRQAVPAKGQILNSIFNTVTSVAAIRGIWLFDAFTATAEIIDWSTKGHSITLRDASLVAQNASSWGPRISGSAFGLTYGDESHLWDIADHNDYSFGDGATDTAFTIITLVKPTLATSCEVFSKDDITTASTKREYAFSLGSDGGLSMFVFDNSTGGYRARTAPGGSVTANQFAVLSATYDASGTAAGVKMYVNSSQVDNATVGGGGAYTAMENLSARPAGYRISTAGVPESFWKGQLYAQMIIAEELTAVQIRQITYLLRSYAGATLS